MEFHDIIEIAKKEMSGLDIIECKDIGDRYAFSFGYKDDEEIPPGMPTVCINKSDGEISYLTIPPLSNLALLRAGKDVTI